jgi:hypothetical protein
MRSRERFQITRHKADLALAMHDNCDKDRPDRSSAPPAAHSTEFRVPFV